MHISNAENGLRYLRMYGVKNHVVEGWEAGTEDVDAFLVKHSKNIVKHGLRIIQPGDQNHL